MHIKEKISCLNNIILIDLVIFPVIVEASNDDGKCMHVQAREQNFN